MFVDLAKAFDTVSQSQLLEMLERIGLRGNTYNLMRSYLTLRTQQIKVGDSLSKPTVIEYGVPQGTVLGPLLFNIYISDLYGILTNGDVASFADDTAIYFSGDSWSSLKATVESDMSKLLHYFKDKLLTVNVEKTCYLPFTSLNSNLPAFTSLNISGECSCDTVTIQSSSKAKYLGLYIDPHLRWNLHTDYVTKKIRSLLYKFKHLKKYLTISQLRILYFALIEPHLVYGIVAWGGVTNNHLKNLAVAQKWVLKIIYNKNYTYSSELLFRESEMLDMRQLFCYATMIKQYTYKKYDVSSHDYSLRNQNSYIYIPRVGKTITQRSFYYLGPKLYSSLPDEIRSLNSLKMFKNKVMKWIRTKSRLEVHSLIDLKNIYYIL